MKILIKFPQDTTETSDPEDRPSGIGGRISSHIMTKGLHIRLPNAVILNRFSVRMFSQGGEGNPLEALKKVNPALLKNALRQMRRDYPGTPLVEIRTDDGTHIRIMP